MFRPGLGEMILLFAVVVLLFGAKKLPGLGGAIGESIKNFKKGIGEGAKEAAKDPVLGTTKTPEQIAAEGRASVNDVDKRP